MYQATDATHRLVGETTFVAYKSAAANRDRAARAPGGKADLHAEINPVKVRALYNSRCAAVYSMKSISSNASQRRVSAGKFAME